MGRCMEINTQRIDEAVLCALVPGPPRTQPGVEGLRLGRMGRLHEKGFITDPVGKAKSVAFTEEGLQEARRLFELLFSR